MMPPSDIPEVSKVDSLTSSSKPDNGKVSDKVKALREQIANGTYQINSKSVAERMVQSGVLNP